MAFRADEAAASGYERVKNYLIPRQLSLSDREKSEEVLLDVIDKCGPVIEGYPTWHPLVSNHDNQSPETYPSERCGYHGLDHTRYFAHGFITCPYDEGESVIKSAHNLAGHPCAMIVAEKLDVKFYAEGTTPILVRCEWVNSLNTGRMIPKSLAIPLMLEQELPAWRWAQRSETWETMRPYLLGAPYGSRSSLFVDQETALVMKKIYMAMVQTGMFGALKTG